MLDVLGLVPISNMEGAVLKRLWAHIATDQVENLEAE